MEEDEDEFGEMPSFDREVNKVAQQLTREQLKNILPAQLTTLKRSKLSSTRASKQQAGLPDDNKVQEVLPLIGLFWRWRWRWRGQLSEVFGWSYDGLLRQQTIEDDIAAALAFGDSKAAYRLLQTLDDVKNQSILLDSMTRRSFVRAVHDSSSAGCSAQPLRCALRRGRRRV